MIRFWPFVIVGVVLSLASPAMADWVDGLTPTFPFPKAKPSFEAKKRADGNVQTKPEQSATRSPQASRLKACPALILGQVEATYVSAVKTPENCGDEAPLKVTAVHGVALKPAALLNCSMTMALANWVPKVQTNARKILKQDLRAIRTAASYVCRRRNNLPDGKFSEHATMNALDVAGFEFEVGKTAIVLTDWQTPEETAVSSTGAFLKAAHRSACQTFTTTLGPEADKHHRSHFHLDLGCHGKTCTFKVCQ